MSINVGAEFEKAMQELELVVAELEREGVSLERSVELYNRGKELHKYCSGVIKDISFKIEKVRQADSDLPE